MAAADRLQLQVILQAVDRATAPLKRITGGSQDAGRALKLARERLKELAAQQKAVGEFKEIRIGLNAAETALGKAQARVKELAQGLGQAGPPTKAMTRELAQARKEAGLASDAFKRKQVQTQQMRDRMTAAGISAGKLAADERRLRADIKGTTAEIDRQTAALKGQAEQQRKLRQLNDRHGKAMLHTTMAGAGGLGYYEAGKRAVTRITAPVNTYSQHEQAMLGIARQVPGARSELGELTPVYRAIEEQIRSLSHEVPLATTAIAEMFTAAARMEVPTEQLKEFTLTASMMATAFDAVPDVITEAMGKVAKNFKLPLTQIEGLADSINFLDDNAISKGADIIDFLNRTSGVVSTVAMSARDAAALGSTLLTLGERTETAGTAANAIVQKFAAAEKGTKKFHAAMSEIGLKTTDVQKGMSTDATGTLMKVIDAVRALPKDKQIGVMVELVGMEHSDTLAKLVDKPEELRRQLDLANSKDAQGSMRREAAARNDTIDAQWLMTKNRMFNASSLMGETLRPAVMSLMQAVNPMLERVTAWVKANPELVAGALKVATVLAAVVAAAGALTFMLALVVGKLLLTRFLFARAAMAVGPLASMLKGPLLVGLHLVRTAVMGLGAALLANPITWIVLAIAAGALLIYKYWAPIKAFFGGLWSGLSAGLAPLHAAFNAAMAPMAPLFAKLMPAWNWFAGVLGTVWGWVSQLLAPFQATQAQLMGAASAGEFFGQVLASLITVTATLPQRFMSLGQDIVRGLISGIASMAGTLVDAIGNLAGSTVGWFKERLGIRSPSRVFAAAGAEIPAGAVQGIASGEGLVRKAALALAGSAIVSLPAMGAATEMARNLPRPELPVVSEDTREALRPPVPTFDTDARQALRPALDALRAESAGALRFDPRPPLAPPSPVGMQAAGNTTIQITINPAPGMDPAAIGRVVAAELDRRERAARSRTLTQLSDYD